ncbi:MAG: DUF4124 domain-containing protein [Georgfuchsia sp.]
MFKATLLILVIISLATPMASSASTLYRCKDEFGHTTYTNYKAENRKCTVLSREETARESAPKSSSNSSNTRAKASPVDFPKVASETQKRRDGDRRYILEQELAAEQKHLEEARKSLDQLGVQPYGGGVESVQPLRDRIALHERNLDALRREMSNLK